MAATGSNFRTRLLDLLHEAGMNWGDVVKGASLLQLVHRLEKKYDASPASHRSSAPPRRPSHHAIEKK